MNTSTGTLNTPGLAQSWRQQRFNPLRTVNPASLGSYIDQYDAGYLRMFSLAAKEIMDRDDVLAAAVPKRKRQVSRRRWDILIGEDVPDDQQAAAETHQQALKYFYSNLTCKNAIEKNETGKVKLLIRRVMEAQFLRYMAAEIEWQPSPEGLTATLHYVPQEFLESTTGELRFAGVSGNAPGTEMDPARWFFAVSDGCIMKAAAIVYMFKRLSLADWLNLLGRFGIPMVHGETTATKGSAEWQEFVNVINQVANDWAAVTSQGSKINLISPSGSGEGPFQPLVDRCDRALARLVMGSDLSTMSRDNAVGSDSQADELDDLVSDDCEWVSEMFGEQLSRKVIEFHFGAGVEPLAFFQIQGPQKQDTKLEMEIDKHVKEFGVNLSKEDIAERYNRTHTEPTPEEKAAMEKQAREKTAADPKAKAGTEAGAANEAVTQAVKDQRTVLFNKLFNGVQDDLKPAVSALLQLETAGSADALRGRILTVGNELPAIERAVLGGDSANQALEVILAAEFLAGLASLGRPSPN